MTAPEWPAGAEASDLGRFEPTAYDLGITDDPEPVAYSLTRLPGYGPQLPSQVDLWQAHTSARSASVADAERERLLLEHRQTADAYLARADAESVPWLEVEPEREAEAEP